MIDLADCAGVKRLEPPYIDGFHTPREEFGSHACSQSPSPFAHSLRRDDFGGCYTGLGARI
jgi:hypothetical protein